MGRGPGRPWGGSPEVGSLLGASYLHVGNPCQVPPRVSQEPGSREPPGPSEAAQTPRSRPWTPSAPHSFLLLLGPLPSSGQALSRCQVTPQACREVPGHTRHSHRAGVGEEAAIGVTQRRNWCPQRRRGPPVSRTPLAGRRVSDTVVEGGCSAECGRSPAAFTPRVVPLPCLLTRTGLRALCPAAHRGARKLGRVSSEPSTACWHLERGLPASRTMSSMLHCVQAPSMGMSSQWPGWRVVLAP